VAFPHLAAAAGTPAAAPAVCVSPGGSSSGGNPPLEDSAEIAEQRRKAQNRGALAQKRFRERQKVRSGANSTHRDP
jgi:hypothetical protein